MPLRFIRRLSARRRRLLHANRIERGQLRYNMLISPGRRFKRKWSREYRRALKAELRKDPELQQFHMKSKVTSLWDWL